MEAKKKTDGSNWWNDPTMMRETGYTGEWLDTLQGIIAGALFVYFLVRVLHL
jgi:hypothetical protein